MKKLPDLNLILKDFREQIKDYRRRMSLEDDSEDYELYSFPQTWGSTALGFSGIGGQVVTSAYTTVIHYLPLGVFGVYFNEGFAYVVTCHNETFIEDLKHMKMASVMQRFKYERTDERAQQFRSELFVDKTPT